MSVENPTLGQAASSKLSEKSNVNSEVRVRIDQARTRLLNNDPIAGEEEFLKGLILLKGKHNNQIRSELIGRRQKLLAAYHYRSHEIESPDERKIVWDVSVMDRVKPNDNSEDTGLLLHAIKTAGCLEKDDASCFWKSLVPLREQILFRKRKSSEEEFHLLVSLANRSAYAGLETLAAEIYDFLSAHFPSDDLKGIHWKYRALGLLVRLKHGAAQRFASDLDRTTGSWEADFDVANQHQIDKEKVAVRSAIQIEIAMLRIAEGNLKAAQDILEHVRQLNKKHATDEVGWKYWEARTWLEIAKGGFQQALVQALDYPGHSNGSSLSAERKKLVFLHLSRVYAQQSLRHEALEYAGASLSLVEKTPLAAADWREFSDVFADGGDFNRGASVLAEHVAGRKALIKSQSPDNFLDVYLKDLYSAWTREAMAGDANTVVQNIGAKIQSVSNVSKDKLIRLFGQLVASSCAANMKDIGPIRRTIEEIKAQSSRGLDLSYMLMDLYDIRSHCRNTVIDDELLSAIVSYASSSGDGLISKTYLFRDALYAIRNGNAKRALRSFFEAEQNNATNETSNPRLRFTQAFLRMKIDDATTQPSQHESGHCQAVAQYHQLGKFQSAMFSGEKFDPLSSWKDDGLSNWLRICTASDHSYVDGTRHHLGLHAEDKGIILGKGLDKNDLEPALKSASTEILNKGKFANIEVTKQILSELSLLGLSQGLISQFLSELLARLDEEGFPFSSASLMIAEALRSLEIENAQTRSAEERLAVAARKHLSGSTDQAVDLIKLFSLNALLKEPAQPESPMTDLAKVDEAIALLADIPGYPGPIHIIENMDHYRCHQVFESSKGRESLDHAKHLRGSAKSMYLMQALSALALSCGHTEKSERWFRDAFHDPEVVESYGKQMSLFFDRTRTLLLKNHRTEAHTLASEYTDLIEAEWKISDRSNGYFDRNMMERAAVEALLSRNYPAVRRIASLVLGLVDCGEACVRMEAIRIRAAMHEGYGSAGIEGALLSLKRSSVTEDQRLAAIESALAAANYLLRARESLHAQQFIDFAGSEYLKTRGDGSQHQSETAKRRQVGALLAEAFACVGNVDKSISTARSTLGGSGSVLDTIGIRKETGKSIQPSMGTTIDATSSASKNIDYLFSSYYLLSKTGRIIKALGKKAESQWNANHLPSVRQLLSWDKEWLVRLGLEALFDTGEQHLAIRLLGDGLIKSFATGELNSIVVGYYLNALMAVDDKELVTHENALKFLDQMYEVGHLNTSYIKEMVKRLTARLMAVKGREVAALERLILAQMWKSDPQITKQYFLANKLNSAEWLSTIGQEDLRVLSSQFEGSLNARSQLVEEQRVLLAKLLLKNWTEVLPDEKDRAMNVAFRLLQSYVIGATGIELASALNRANISADTGRRAVHEYIKVEAELKGVLEGMVNESVTTDPKPFSTPKAFSCPTDGALQTTIGFLDADDLLNHDELYIRMFEMQAKNYRVQRKTTRLSQLQASYPSIREDATSAMATEMLRPADLKEVQNRLGPNQAVIFLATTKFDTFVFLVTNKSFLVRDAKHKNNKLGTDKIVKLIESLWGKDDLGARNTFDRGTARDLYRALFGIFDKELADIKDLTLVVRGALEQLPFGALVVPSKKMGKPTANRTREDYQWFDERFLWSFGLAPSRVRHNTEDIAPNRSKIKDGLTVQFGPPSFLGKEPECASPTRTSLKSPNTPISNLLCRIDRLRNLMPADVADKSPDRVVKRIGEQVTKRSLLELNANGTLQNAETVIVASHGLLASESFTLGGHLEPAIVLGAHSMDDQKFSSFLYPSEISELSLNNSEIILAACNSSAPGPSSKERTFSGLVRAFLIAGASHLVAAQNSINADFTGIQLNTYFKERGKSVRPKEALQKSKDELRKRGVEDPGLWSGLVIVESY